MPDNKPMPWSPRRKIALALVIAFVGFGLGVFFWRNTAGISGEVFIVTDDGKSDNYAGSQCSAFEGE
jgi:hypothetical protein